MSELNRLRAAIIAEIRDAVQAAIASEAARLEAELARVAQERDDALQSAENAQDIAAAERAAREGVEAAYADYRVRVQDLAAEIEAPGMFGADDPEPEPEPGDDDEPGEDESVDA